MADYSTFNFSQLVEQAISDFNSIFKALKDKSVQYKPTVNSEWTSLSDDTRGIATSDYWSLIDTQLYRIAGVYSKSAVTHTNGIIANHSGASAHITASSVGVTPTIVYPVSSGDSSILVTSSGFDAGYYDTNSNLTITLSGYSAVIQGTQTTNSTTTVVTHDGSGATTSIKYTPTNNSIIKDITINPASLAINNTSFSGVDQVTTTWQSEIPNTNTTNATLTQATGANAPTYVTIPVNISANVAGTITTGWAIDTDHFVAGYLNEVLTTHSENNLDLDESYTTSFNIYVPNSEITTPITGSDSINMVVPNDITTYNDNTGNNGDVYTITGQLTQGALNGNTISVTGAQSIGYVGNSRTTLSGTATVTPASIYVKKGTMQSFSYSSAQSEAKLSAVGSSGLVINSNESDDYTVTFTLGAISETQSFTDGYITASSYNVNVASASKTIKIPKAHIAVAAGAPSVTLTASSGILHPYTGSEGSGRTIYQVTAKVTSALSLTSDTAGYVSNPTNEIGKTGLTNANATNSYYIYGAHAEIQPTLSTVIHNDTSNNNADGASQALDGSNNPIDIFSSTAPVSGDYYTITAGYTKENVEAGYLSGTSDISSYNNADTAVKYLPKAVFNYVVNSTSGDYIQVTTGGYIPSGIIHDIASLTGAPDFAAVQASLSITDNILHTGTAGANDYVLSIAKSASTNAGYFSGSNDEGTLALTNNYFIARGSATVSGAVSVGTLSNPTWVAGTGYVISGTASATLDDLDSNNFTEGYFKLTDITLSNISDQPISKTLAKATIGSTIIDTNDSDADVTSTVPLEVDSGNTNITVTQNGTYKVTVQIPTGIKTRAAVTGEGYVKVGDSVLDTTIGGDLTVKMDAATLTAGRNQSNNTPVQGSITFNDGNFSTAGANGYPIQASYTDNLSYVQATEGYIPSGSSAVYTTATGNGTFYVPAGSLAEAITVNTTLRDAQTEVALITEGNRSGSEDYVKIVGKPSSLTRSGTITAGYFKQYDYEHPTSETLTLNSVNEYIKVFRDSRIASGGDRVITEAGGVKHTIIAPLTNHDSNYVEIVAADTYNKYNIYASIGPEAYGSTISTYIENLRERIQGTLIQELPQQQGA